MLKQLVLAAAGTALLGGNIILSALSPAAANPCPKRLAVHRVYITDGDPCCYPIGDASYASIWKHGGCLKPVNRILCFLGVGSSSPRVGKREEEIG